ncbi:MAG: hypothetical protein ABI618_07030 [Nitrospirota bacterium]
MIAFRPSLQGVRKPISNREEKNEHTFSFHKPTLVSITWFLLAIMFMGQATAGQFGASKDGEGTRIFTPAEHPTYSGHFRLTGQNGTLIGRMDDKAPWDRMDYAGKHLNPIVGNMEIEVNERTNIGHVHAEFVDGADQY